MFNEMFKVLVVVLNIMVFFKKLKLLSNRIIVSEFLLRKEF